MLEKMKELMDECDELMELSMCQMGIIEAMTSLDDESFKTIQKFLKMYDKSKKLSLELAMMVESQDKKLDQIIKLLEKQK